ncbi:MAG: hypothetical protein DLM70_17885 [Chloroflexi bacterium]|nr:MAG: hypothetical protein DLM70_17885 [Chloroflexota bacterium]
MVDVHHRDHPVSKNRTDNGISLGFTAHYDRMRAHFGRHLTEGIAGENILVQTDTPVADSDLVNGVLIVTANGKVLRLHDVQVAEPCVEFTRYALRCSCRQKCDHPATEGLRFLRGGMRGFYVSYAGEPALVHPGDRVSAI